MTRARRPSGTAAAGPRRSDDAGASVFSYVARGMSWQADYKMVVSDNPKSKTDLLDIVG
jgi:hypothetical protein